MSRHTWHSSDDTNVSALQSPTQPLAGVQVAVGVDVGVRVGVCVAVLVGDGVTMRSDSVPWPASEYDRSTVVGVDVGVFVAVRVGVCVIVPVCVTVGVIVGVAVADAGGVGVGVNVMHRPTGPQMESGTGVQFEEQ